MKIDESKIQEAIEEAEKALASPRKDAKFLIQTYIDGDVLEALKIEANGTGVSYQDLINIHLRSTVLRAN